MARVCAAWVRAYVCVCVSVCLVCVCVCVCVYVAVCEVCIISLCLGVSPRRRWSSAFLSVTVSEEDL